MIINLDWYYFIVLWSRYPEDAEGLHDHLRSHLREDEGITKPFAVLALDKTSYISGECIDVPEIARAVGEVSTQHPGVAALFNWEDGMSRASAGTVLSVLHLAQEGGEKGELNRSISELLAQLAKAAVGLEHMEDSRFRAVNEALLPILADRVATIRQNGKLWESAWSTEDAKSELELEQIAKLNQLLHIARLPHDMENGGERGAVIRLPGCIEREFEARFGIPPAEAARKQFGWESCEEEFFWVLVQSQAACDYAQKSTGALPYHLGLCLSDKEVGGGSMPAAIWRSPAFDLGNGVRYLHVNARFQILLPRDQAESASPVFRLREQLLDQMIYLLHDYMSRPGIVAFAESEKARKARRKRQK